MDFILYFTASVGICDISYQQESNSQSNRSSLYSIIAPNTLRPNSQYHVAVSIHKAPEPAKVKVGIIGSTYSDFKTIEVRPFSTETVHFEIPALKNDRYNLTAEGLSGIRFTNETKLNFDAKQFTVMVQSDKAIYKPQDIVHYRVYIMDANLKPALNYGRALPSEMPAIMLYENTPMLD
ncbi:hypothetical protein DOY81_013398 [Sarcophaga bullata]|nr:hypothetical protein DOY81_013398 [Sarcophaga bullata]